MHRSFDLVMLRIHLQLFLEFIGATFDPPDARKQAEEVADEKQSEDWKHPILVEWCLQNIKNVQTKNEERHQWSKVHDNFAGFSFLISF